MRRTGQTQDPDFNTITVKKIKASGQNSITVLSDIDILKPSQLSVTQLRISQEDDKQKGFILDIDENRPTTLIIKRVLNDIVLDQGILYDTEFNKPDGILYISPVFTLPEQESNALDFMMNNMSFIICLDTQQENTSFTLSPLTIYGADDYKQIRISNLSLYPINIVFEGNTLIQMYHERVSLVWCKRDTVYSWVYVP
jgi:hypothetical protein